jgi:Prophage minor tail protein Z (GPZ)
MQINVSTNASQLLDQVALDSREMRTAVMRSLNRTADGVKTDASREIRKSYNVTNKALSPAFSIWRATTVDLVAKVSASGRPLQLIGFAARQVKAGVSVSVKRGSRKVVKSAFIARMQSGHLGVFRRAGRKRLPIDELYTVSVPGMFGAHVVQDALKKLAGERFDKAMGQNINFVIARRG